MLKGSKVGLRKYEDYSLTKTEDFYCYSYSMRGFAMRGEKMELVSIEEHRVRLRCSDGFEWNFHKDDVILNMSFENK